MSEVDFSDYPIEMFPFTIQAFPAGSTINEDPVWIIIVIAPGKVPLPEKRESDPTVRIIIYWPDETMTSFQPRDPENERR